MSDIPFIEVCPTTFGREISARSGTRVAMKAMPEEIRGYQSRSGLRADVADTWAKTMNERIAHVAQESHCPTVDDVVLPCFEVLVDLELARARKKHVKMRTVGHAIKVIDERLSKMEELLYVEGKHERSVAMLHELTKLAALCKRTAEDLGFVEIKGLELETRMKREAGARA